MNRFELKIWDDERKRCTFYTVRWEDGAMDETDKFLAKYETDTKHKAALQMLVAFVLQAIGDRHGANKALFNRWEQEVDGLPVQGKVKIDEFDYHYPNFPLRLYALRIRKNIVILFNGGIKDGETNQTSSLKMQWIEACMFAKRIDDAIKNGEIIVDFKNRKLTNHVGGDEIIL